MLSHNAFCNLSQRRSFQYKYSRSVQFIFQLVPNLLDKLQIMSLLPSIFVLSSSINIYKFLTQDAFTVQVKLFKMLRFFSTKVILKQTKYLPMEWEKSS